MFDHCCTRTGGRDDGIGVRAFKDLNKTPGELLRLAPIPGVKGRLAAARLPLVKNHFAPDTPQYLDHAHTHIRIKLIDETCDK
jgi:hypothetical protein